VVAEGVETEDQANQLRSLACDYAQGNYFSHAIPAAEAEKLISPARQTHFASASGPVLRIQ